MSGFCALASGSKGNCLYFESSTTKILIDAGIPPKLIQQRLQEINRNITDIEAILISHEHTDHILGLKSLSSQYHIPILANRDTAKAISHIFSYAFPFQIFLVGEAFTIGNIEVFSFNIPHDAVDPVGFILKVDGLKIGICTDLGFPTTYVKHQLKNCDFLYIESNHEPSMVHSSSRSMHYKERVLSRHGHLSNEACGVVLQECKSSQLKHVMLSHLSEECNTHHKALSQAQKILEDIPASIAPQHTISSFIQL